MVHNYVYVYRFARYKLLVVIVITYLEGYTKFVYLSCYVKHKQFKKSATNNKFIILFNYNWAC